MKPVGFSQWNTPPTRTRTPPPKSSSSISERLQISNGCAINPAVSGPLAVDLSQSLTPRGRLGGPSLASISDICSGLGFHSRGGQRESICSFKKSLTVPWVLMGRNEESAPFLLLALLVCYSPSLPHQRHHNSKPSFISSHGSRLTGIRQFRWWGGESVNGDREVPCLNTS